VIGYYTTGGHMKHWGARGTFWNGLWKILAGGAYFVEPDIGGVLIAGPLTLCTVAALKDPVEHALSAVGAGLNSINIPKASIVRYEALIRMHKLLLIAHGTAPELLRTRDLLHDSRPVEISVHFAEDGVQVAA
jgi:hypothetical protein